MYCGGAGKERSERDIKEERKQDKRTDLGRRHRLIGIESKVSGTVWSWGSRKREKSFHLWTGSGERGARRVSRPQSQAAFVGHVGGDGPSLLNDPHSGMGGNAVRKSRRGAAGNVRTVPELRRDRVSFTLYSIKHR